MNTFKRILSMILCAALLISTVCLHASAKSANVQSTDTVQQALDLLTPQTEVDHTRHTNCNGSCDYTPIIIVPGIMQSQVYVQQKDGSGDMHTVDGFPIVEGMDMEFMFDTKSVKQDLKKMLFPMLINLLTGRKNAFTDQVCEILDKCFYSHYFNTDGTRQYPAAVDEYWYSFEEAKNHPEKSYNYAKSYREDKDGNTIPSTKYETEFDFIMAQVDVSSYAKKAGYDHMYYFAYSSFGDTFSIAKRLDDYIQMVKDQTGHDKVSIVFISLGGTIGNVYLSEYCDPNDIDRIVFAAAAVDGSYLLSSLMNADLILGDKSLYTSMLPDLMTFSPDNLWLGYLLSVLIRFVPQKFLSGFVSDVAYEAIHRVLGNLLYNCPSMWALVPSAEYPAMADELIQNSVLREKTDAYYRIQKRAAQTLRRLRENGMEIFAICGYNLPMPSILSCYAYSSDNIIQTASASIGATVAPFGETLPADYVPAIDKSYLSPGRELDAGTCALPDHTWFIRNQSHMTLQKVMHDTIELCIQIVADKGITDARTNNGGYKQFNNYRPTRYLVELCHTYESLTAEQIAALPAKKAAALRDAYAQGTAVLDSMDWDEAAAIQAEKAMYTALYNVKLLPGQSRDTATPFKRYEWNPILEKITGTWSRLTNKLFGAQDFIPFV